MALPALDLPPLDLEKEELPSLDLPPLDLSPFKEPTFEEEKVGFATAAPSATMVAEPAPRTKIGEDLPPTPVKPELDVRRTMAKEPEPEVPLGETLAKEQRKVLTEEEEQKLFKEAEAEAIKKGKEIQESGLTPKEFAEKEILGKPKEDIGSRIANTWYKMKHGVGRIDPSVSVGSFFDMLGQQIQKKRPVSAEETLAIQYEKAKAEAQETKEQRERERQAEYAPVDIGPKAEPSTTAVPEKGPELVPLDTLEPPVPGIVQKAKDLIVSAVDKSIEQGPEFIRQMVGSLVEDAPELLLGEGALQLGGKLLTLTAAGKRLEKVSQLEKLLKGMSKTDKILLRKQLGSTLADRAALSAGGLVGETGVFLTPEMLETGELPTGKEAAGMMLAVLGFRAGRKVIGKIAEGAKKEVELAKSKFAAPTKPGKRISEKVEKEPEIEVVEKTPPQEVEGVEEIIKKGPVKHKYVDKLEKEDYDELTEVANSNAIRKEVRKAVDPKDETKNKYIGAVDIDYFKRINDVLGHDIGDKVLKAMGRELKKSFGAEIVGRQGGDEFMVVFNKKPNIAQLTEFFENFPDRVNIEGEPVALSMGVAKGKKGDALYANLLQEEAKGIGNRLIVDLGEEKLYIKGRKIERGERTYAERHGLQQAIREQERVLEESEILSPKERKRIKGAIQALRREEKGLLERQAARRLKKTPEEKASAKEKELASQTGVATFPSGTFKSAKKKIPEPARKAHEDMVSEIQVREFESDAYVNSLERNLNKNERKALPFVIEKTKIPKELKDPALEKLDLSDPKLQTTAREVRDHFHKQWKFMQDNIKDFSANEIENYVTHIWDIPKNKVSEAVNWFTTRNPFLKKRFIATYEAGIKKGYKPKTTNIAEIIRIHDRYAIRTTMNKKFLEAIKAMEDENGVKLLMPEEKGPTTYLKIDHPVLKKTRFLPGKEGGAGKLVRTDLVYHPTLDPMMQAVFGKRWQAEGIGGNMLKAYEVGNALLKQTQLSLSLFHHAALSETAVATIGPIQTAKILLNAKGLYKALVKKEFDIYGKKFEVAKDAIKEGGVQIGAISDVQRGVVNKFLQTAEDELMKGFKPLGMAVKVAKTAKFGWDRALWDYLHNNFKVYGYERLSGKLIKQLKNPTPELISAAKKEAGKFINDSFGGQNWELLMTNPKNLQMAQWFLLSPDWTVSTIKQALAPLGIGSVASKGMRSKLGRAFWAKAGIYFGLGMNALNTALVAQDEANHKGITAKEQFENMKKMKPEELARYTMWGNDPGHRSHLFVGRYDDGSKRYVRWGKQFRELFELIYDSQAEQWSPISAAKAKIGGKTSPLVQNAFLLFASRSPGGFKNRELDKATGWDWVGKISRHIISSPLPFSFNAARSETKEFKVTDLAFPSSKGMSHFKTRKLFKKAIIDKRQEYVRRIYVAAHENNLPAKEILKEAITDLKRDATVEINEDIKRRTGRGDISLKKYAENSIEYVKSLDLTAREAAAIGKILGEEKARRAQIENWMTLMESADERIKAYYEEQEGKDKKISEQETE